MSYRIKYKSDSLLHYGIKGQQWGLRRFQNEDGTLTEEGKARYLDQMTDRQKNQYLQMPENRQKAVSNKMAEGKSFNRSVREVREEISDRNRKVGAAVLTGVALLASPITRNLIKSVGRFAVKSIAKTKTVQRGAQYLAKAMDRHAAKKAGAIILKKAAYNIL